jgi:hypothetical protein
MPKDPTSVASKWAARSSSASGDYVDGATSYQGNPAQQAASKADVWQARLGQPETKAKFTRGLGRVSAEDWKNSIRQKGASRFASGVQSAQPKMQSFMTEFLPFQQQITDRVRGIPKLSLEDGIRRATEQIRGTAAFRKGR